MQVDYIIVGAGAAGCVLAERLSRDPSTRVLLVENGGPARDPMVSAPKGFFFMMNKPKYTYQYPTWPLGHDGHTENWIRGKVEGGSTAINGMLYARGSSADYDSLAAQSPEWGWKEMLSAFRALEDHPFGPSAEHGTEGPLSISFSSENDQVIQAVRGSAVAAGLPVVPDVDSAVGEAIGPVASTIRGGRRVSAATAFLTSARRRSNLVILSGSRVGHLLFDGSRCVGVRIRRRGEQHEHTAARQVIVAAGALESPLLLERSGVGPGGILRDAGVAMRRESPNVGEKLVEQRAVTLTLRLKDELGYNALFDSRPKRVWQAAKYLLRRQGPVATGPYPLRASIRTVDSLRRPDAALLFTAMSLDDTGSGVADHPGMTITGYSVHPTTTSRVHLRGPDPDTVPMIEASYLQTEEDRHAVAAILHRQRELAATDPLAALVCKEESPGLGVQTNEQVVDYALATGAGLYHAVGSCAMGPREEDVVDHRLRVRGVPGLRVIDASIFPTAPSAATAAPVMAAAWRGADLLIEEED